MDRELWNHSNYGKGELGPGLFEHIADMAPMDRMIFEDCRLRGSSYRGYVDHPQIRVDDFGARWKSPQWVKLKLGYLFSDPEIEELMASWKVIEPDEKLTRCFIEWCLTVERDGPLFMETRKVECLQYFKQLENELDFATMATDDRELADDDEIAGNPTTLVYHALHDEGDGRPMLSIEELNRLFWKILDMKTVQDYDELVSIGKWLYGQNCMTWPDAKRVWEAYRSKKAELLKMSEQLPKFTWEVFSHIKSAKSVKELNKIARSFYIDSRYKELNKAQMGRLWGSWRKKKNAMEVQIESQRD